MTSLGVLLVTNIGVIFEFTLMERRLSINYLKIELISNEKFEDEPRRAEIAQKRGKRVGERQEEKQDR